MKKRMIETQKALLSMLLVSVLILGGCRKEQSSNPATTTETTTIEQSSILSSENKSTQESEVESLEGKTSEGTKEESSKSSSKTSSKISKSEASSATSNKPAKTKPAETKPAETKPAETKPAETKPAKTKPAETKPAETKPAETKPAETKPAETKPAETKPVETKPVEKPVTPTKPATPTTPNVDEPAKKTLVSLVYAQTKPIDHCNQIPDTTYVSATATFSDGSTKQATVVSIYLSTIKGDAHTYSVKASLDGSEHSGVVTLQREPFNEEAYKGILTLSTSKKAANGKRKLTGADMDAYSKLFWSVQAAHNHLPFTHDVDYYFKDGANITTNEDDYTLEEIYEIAYAGLQRMRVHQNVPAFKSRHPVLMKQAQDHAGTIAALPNYCDVTIMGQGAKFHTNHYYDGVTYNALVHEQIDAGLGGYWTEMLDATSGVDYIYFSCESLIAAHCPLSTRSDMTDVGIGIAKIKYNKQADSGQNYVLVIQVSGRDK